MERSSESARGGPARQGAMPPSRQGFTLDQLAARVRHACSSSHSGTRTVSTCVAALLRLRLMMNALSPLSSSCSCAAEGAVRGTEGLC